MLKRSSFVTALCAAAALSLAACGGGSGVSTPIPQPTPTSTPLIPVSPGGQPGSPSPTPTATATATANPSASPMPSATPTAAPTSAPTATPTPAATPGTLDFLVKHLGIFDGTAATIRTGFSFNGTPYSIVLTNPDSGITAQWTGGDLHVQGHCPTFVPATDIVITDTSGNKGSINVACATIPSGQTSYASPFEMTVRPKAHQDVFVYGVGQPIAIQPHDTTVSSVSPGPAQAQFTITALATGIDGVTFQDNASPPNSAGVTVNVVQ